jgi:hypothetical protein
MIAERIIPVRGRERGTWLRELWARKPWRQVRLPGVFRLVLRRPRDAACAIVATAALATIVANSLFMQPGPHPAPIFAIRPLPVVSREATGTVAQLPRPRPAVVAAQKLDVAAKADAVPLPRPRGQGSGTHADPIADLINPSRQLSAVQRVLNEFGYGPIKVSGNFDDDTREGIERFERDHHLAVTGQFTPRLRRELSLATGRPLD